MPFLQDLIVITYNRFNFIFICPQFIMRPDFGNNLEVSQYLKSVSFDPDAEPECFGFLHDKGDGKRTFW